MEPAEVTRKFSWKPDIRGPLDILALALLSLVGLTLFTHIRDSHRSARRTRESECKAHLRSIARAQAKHVRETGTFATRFSDLDASILAQTFSDQSKRTTVFLDRNSSLPPGRTPPQTSRSRTLTLGLSGDCPRCTFTAGCFVIVEEGESPEAFWMTSRPRNFGSAMRDGWPPQEFAIGSTLAPDTIDAFIDRSLDDPTREHPP